MYDVVIIGAGPAGLFCAYELAKKSKLKILLLDKGHMAEKRYCPMHKEHTACKNCNPCAILSGMGGAGTFSDGKLNFIPKLGKSDLYKYMSISEADNLINETEQIFNEFDMDAEVFPSNMDEALKIKKDVAIKGGNLLIIKQKHLGSDKLPGYICSFTNHLKDNNIEIIEMTEVTDIINKKGIYEIKYTKGNKKISIDSKRVVVAPGRTGAKWVQFLADKYKIDYVSNSIEIGVRIETRKEILESITKVIYDPTIFIKTNKYNDEIRTFCTNPGGFVAKENYFGYICVNGHSLKEIKSNNSNFAFIVKVNLTEPTTNTREFGESIAIIAKVLGNGKPIIQRLQDLKSGRRSTWNRINKSYVEPTLKDCVAGDLGLVLPHRLVIDILEGLETLDKIIPGVNNDETLLYGPEIKFFSNEITTDNNMKLKNEDIYFIGDGCGKSGNIVTSAATGLISARDILKKIKKDS